MDFLKLVLFILIASSASAWSFDTCLAPGSQESQTLKGFELTDNVRDVLEKDPGDGKIFSSDGHLVDLCIKNVTSISRKKGINVCLDGLVSFSQNLKKKWEGECGQTAAENVLYSYCKKNLRQTLDLGTFFKDITPGTTPRTLKNGLNSLFKLFPYSCPKSGAWEINKYNSDQEFLRNLKKSLNVDIPEKHKSKRIRSKDFAVSVTPAIVLIHIGGKSLHWVTVVDMFNEGKVCQVVYMEYGKQKQVSCSELATSAYEAGIHYPLIDSYTVVNYQNQ